MGSNCTLLELKRLAEASFLAAVQCSNCTILELKLVCESHSLVRIPEDEMNLYR